MRISDWSSDVCSSDLVLRARLGNLHHAVDEQAQPLLGRHPPRTGVRAGQEAEFLEILHHVADRRGRQIGRASGRERVCQYVYISVVAVSLKKEQKEDYKLTHNSIYRNNLKAKG